MLKKKSKLTKFLILLGIIIVLLEIVRMIAVSRVRVVLDKQVTALKERGIDATYEKVQFGWFNISVIISNIKIAGLNEADSVFSASVDQIDINHIKLKKLLFEKQLLIGHLDVDEIHLKTRSKYKMKSYTPVSKDTSELTKLRINEIQLSGIKWESYDENDSLSLLTSADKFLVGGFRIDSMRKQPVKYEFSSISTGDVSFKAPKGQHVITVQDAMYDEIKGELRLDSITVRPLLTKSAFAIHFKKQVDRLSASSKSVVFKNITFWDKNTMYIRADRLDMDFNLETYRDKTYPFARKKVFPMPNELLKMIGVKFNLDTVNLHDSFIAYEELTKKDRDPGRIFFKNFHLEAFNFTNDERQGSNKIKINTQFMENGAIGVNFFMPFDTSEKYTATGFVSPFDLSELNSIMKSAVLLEMKSGHLDTLNFGFQYDDRLSTGRVEFKFTDLKMTAYKSKNPDKVSLFKSIAINQLIRINDVKNAFLVGKIYYERNPVKSIFSYWWKSLLSGLKSTMLKNGSIIPSRKKGSDDFFLDFEEE